MKLSFYFRVFFCTGEYLNLVDALNQRIIPVIRNLNTKYAIRLVVNTTGESSPKKLCHIMQYNKYSAIADVPLPCTYGRTYNICLGKTRNFTLVIANLKQLIICII